MGRVYEGVGPAWAKYNESGVGNCMKRGKRVSFEGPWFYSYGTTVASYHTGPGGNKFVLISSNRWSVSTTSHQSHAARSANVPVFHVPYISSGKDTHDMNMDCLIRDFMNVEVKRAKAGWKPGEWRYPEERCESALRKEWGELARYKRLSGSTVELPNIENLIVEVAAERQRRRDEFYDPKAVARRARASARKEARKALRLIEE